MNKTLKKRILPLVIAAALAAGCTPTTISPTSAVQPSTTPVELATAAPAATKASPTVLVVTPTVSIPTAGLEATPGHDFCANAEVQALITGLVSALKEQNGTALANLIDPVNGLDIYYRLANPAVHIAPDEAAGLFSSTFTYTWGDQAGSGLPVEGTFNAEILPLLLNVTEKEFTQACQDLSRGVGTGPTTAMVDWPAEFSGMPFIALFRAPGPQDNELDWRTWAVGLSVVNGQPKIRVLVQYSWEI